VKRFYATATVEAGAILLDGRPVRTPARAPLMLPTPALAEAVAAEWAAQGERIDPASMPLTGLANAAIDRVAPDPAAFAAPIIRYSETDALCYRAESPAELRREQAAAWDPLLDWARVRFDVAFAVTSGVIPVAQPPHTVSRLGEAIMARDPFALAALQPLVTIGGSLVAALAVAEAAFAAPEAFAATHLDELWQARLWGEDELATRARAARERDFLVAARFLAFLRLAA
jgi:chaperone required for assembly of F1-ATPase